MNIHFISFSGVSELKFSASTRAKLGSRRRCDSAAAPIRRAPDTPRNAGVVAAAGLSAEPATALGPCAMQPPPARRRRTNATREERTGVMTRAMIAEVAAERSAKAVLVAPVPV